MEFEQKYQEAREYLTEVREGRVEGVGILILENTQTYLIGKAREMGCTGERRAMLMAMQSSVEEFAQTRDLARSFYFIISNYKGKDVSVDEKRSIKRDLARIIKGD